MWSSIEIEGVNYSVELFKEFGKNGMPQDALFQIVSRTNGDLTIKRINGIVFEKVGK